MIQETTAAVARKPRRPAARSTRGQGEKSTKTAVYLSAESMRKLGVTSLMEGRTQSDIIDELIRLHLRKYRVQTLDRAVSEDCDGQAMVQVSDAA